MSRYFRIGQVCLGRSLLRTLLFAARRRLTLSARVAVRAVASAAPERRKADDASAVASLCYTNSRLKPTNFWRTLRGPCSAVSTPILATKYSFATFCKIYRITASRASRNGFFTAQRCQTFSNYYLLYPTVVVCSIFPENKC